MEIELSTLFRNLLHLVAVLEPSAVKSPISCGYAGFLNVVLGGYRRFFAEKWSKKKIKGNLSGFLSEALIKYRGF